MDAGTRRLVRERAGEHFESYPGNQDPHKSLQPIWSSNSRSWLPGDQRSTTESTEIHGKENPNQLPLSVSVSFPGRAHARRVGSPARRVGSFRGCPFVMIFLAVVIPDRTTGLGLFSPARRLKLSQNHCSIWSYLRLPIGFVCHFRARGTRGRRWHCTAPTTELRKTHSGLRHPGPVRSCKSRFWDAEQVRNGCRSALPVTQFPVACWGLPIVSQMSSDAMKM